MCRLTQLKYIASQTTIPVYSKVQLGEFQSTEVHRDTKNVATGIARLQLKGLCVRDRVFGSYH